MYLGGVIQGSAQSRKRKKGKAQPRKTKTKAISTKKKPKRVEILTFHVRVQLIKVTLTSTKSSRAGKKRERIWLLREKGKKRGPPGTSHSIQSFGRRIKQD